MVDQKRVTKPTVAVIGASRSRDKFGNLSVRAHLKHGYEVFPINPFTNLIEGLQSYRSLDDLPIETLDRVTVYVPPEIGLTLLDSIARKRPREVWFNPGSSHDELLARAEEIGLPLTTACSILALESQ